MRTLRRWQAILVGSLLGWGGRGRTEPANADDSAGIVVVVLDGTRKPVARAEARVWQAGDRASGVSESTLEIVRTDGEGKASLRHLSSSVAYRLEVVPPDTRPDLATLDVVPWKPVGGTFLLPDGFTVSGVVRDPLHRSLARVEVNRPALGRSADGAQTEGDGRTVRPDGSFEYKHIPRGHVPLRAVRRDERFVEHNAALALATPEHPKVELVLAEGDEPAPLVRRIEGITLAHRAMLIGNPDPAIRQNRVAHTSVLFGMFEVGGAQAWIGAADGTFALEPTIETFMSSLWVPPTSADDDLSLYVPEVGFHVPDQVLHLTPGLAIRGRVTGMVAHLDARVHANVAEASRVAGRIADDGAFSIRGLPAGTWRVVVEIGPQAAPGQTGLVDAEAGRSDVVIQLK